MSQTQVQNAKSVRLGSVVMRHNGVNLGMLKGAKVTATRSIITFSGDNAKLPPRSKLTKVMLEGELYEVDLANFDKIDGAGVSTQVAGVSTPVPAEVLRASGSWAPNEPIFFANKNGDNTIVSSIVVKNGTATLTAGTDYTTVLENGKTGIVRIGTALTLSGIGLNVGYTYTPNAKRVYTYSDILRSVALGEITFTNTDENGKEYKITIPKGYNTANLNLVFPSDDQLDEAQTYPFSFEAYPDENNVMLKIEDEQAV